MNLQGEKTQFIKNINLSIPQINPQIQEILLTKNIKLSIPIIKLKQ